MLYTAHGLFLHALSQRRGFLESNRQMLKGCAKVDDDSMLRGVQSVPRMLLLWNLEFVVLFAQTAAVVLKMGESFQLGWPKSCGKI